MIHETANHPAGINVIRTLAYFAGVATTLHPFARVPRGAPLAVHPSTRPCTPRHAADGRRKSMMSLKTLKLGSLALAAAVATLASTGAAAADGVRVRGTVASISGDTLVVKSRDGDSVSIKLNAGWKAGGIVKAKLSDIKPGDFVGIASLPTAAGGDGALEVLIFPPSMRGTGEGSYGWDLKPNSSMTNGAVSEAVQSVDGTTVNVVYHGQSKKIVIAPNTPIVTFAPAVNADVKPGAAVFVPADRADDGKLSTTRVVVGKDGIVPPM